jgi:hypothetical protein
MVASEQILGGRREAVDFLLLHPKQLSMVQSAARIEGKTELRVGSNEVGRNSWTWG